MTTAALQRHTSAPSVAAVHGSFRVEMLGSQESLDLDCNKFFTEYILRCTWTDRTGESDVWDVVRRYREFCAIDLLLREKYPSRASMFPLLPSKKLFGSSLSAEFVDKRQRDLGYYISSILHGCPWLVQDEIIDSFLDIKRHILERAREQERKRIQQSHAAAASAAGARMRALHVVNE
ncbi:hypothetical protein Poli38472_006162 [Pythium oligandrum]|uniref:PX domain-containing protein n=1 Tax=Pythium oligandrum TaxID=41045 RepID=A0A8K1CSD9_PYTOL|nr:hypothetical protein Poli38472_006162 [Pythium oligandrum]|eukprot:TMW68694.1 hypothetical protein Poli38472_006162 [Pythium oligandrum]